MFAVWEAAPARSWSIALTAMNSSTIPILVALFIQLALGQVVFQANRHRKANQSFLLLSLVTTGSLFSPYSLLTTSPATAAALWIRYSSVFAVFLLAVFTSLRLSIKN